MISSIKPLISNYNFIEIENGKIIDKNCDVNNFKFNQNIELVVLNHVNGEQDFTIEIMNDISVKIIEICILEKKSKLNKSIKCFNNSKLELITLETSDDSVWVNVNASLEEKAYFNNRKVSLFNCEVNECEKVYLTGSYSDYYAANVYINSSNCKQNIDTVIYHKNTDTTSQLFNYGICKGNSILNINTNGIVEKGAVRSDLKQKSKGVLLDLESSISANPLLQIDEYDCLASHGAGIGAISEEDLYYLMSRGLSRNEAGKLIISGFIGPVVEGFPEGDFKNYISDWINKYL